MKVMATSLIAIEQELNNRRRLGAWREMVDKGHKCNVLVDKDKHTGDCSSRGSRSQKNAVSVLLRGWRISSLQTLTLGYNPSGLAIMPAS